MSNSLQPHGLQQARPPCPSPTPGLYSNSCPLNRWCHPTISSSVVPISSHLQSFPASGSFPISQLFTWGDQSIGVSASTSVVPMNIQDWSLRLTGWISLLFKGLSRVFSNTIVEKHQFFSAYLSLQFNSHPWSYGVTQVQMEEGKEKKERAKEIEGIPLFQRNTPTSVPTAHTSIHDAGGGSGAGRIKGGRAHPQLTVRGTGTLSTYLLICGTTVSERLAQHLGKKTCPAGGHEGGSWRSKDRTWRGAWRPQGWQGDQAWVWARGPPNIFQKQENDLLPP